jgi:hypothetical protein
MDCHVATLLAMTGVVESRDCYVATLLAMTEGGIMALPKP